MNRRLSARGRALTLAAACLVGAATLATATVARAAGPPSYSLATLGAYGGEPSIISDGNGVLYDTSPSGPSMWRSTDQGQTWAQIQSADNNSGDDCLGVDVSNALYWCNLASMTAGNLPLQADDWKSTVASTCTTSCAWVHGDGAISGQCSTSCSPFGVDRQWTAAEIPQGGTTDTAEVVLMYHDFYGPSNIWVNISKDGGKTFGAPQNVLASFAATPGGLTGTVSGEAFTFCNTVPAGVGIAPLGTPHAGRIMVGWIAADAVTDGSGCNISMAQAFHVLLESYSDDGGATWTAQVAYDAGEGHDASTPFVGFTLDTQGNPYFDFDAQANNTGSSATCGAESAAGMEQSDPTNCDYNNYVVYSTDGGATFGDGAGLLPGSASAAFQANPTTETGTDVFPTIAVNNPGQVAISYLHTATIEPQDAAGKFLPGGCGGSEGGLNPPTYPQTPCSWQLETSQADLTGATPSNATWQYVAATPAATPTHLGDICNLGIACGPTSNRNLLDFNQETIDPTTGCAHISYADDNTINKLRVANQTGGCFAPATVLGEAPLAALMIPVAAAAFIGYTANRRRRIARRSAVA